MRRAVLIAVVPLLIVTPALAQQKPNTIQKSGEKLLNFAAQVNQSEIQAGLAAEKKADAPAVRAFARLMVFDHMELESQLAAIATEDRVELPNGPSEQAKEQMATLQNLSGTKFDAEYMQHMVKGHEQAVQKLKSESGEAHSPPVNAVVSATLPIIEQHLALARAVLSAINNQATVGSAQSSKASSQR